MKKIPVLVALLAVMGGMGVVLKSMLDRENWANVETVQTFAFGPATLVDDARWRAADLDEIREDEFINQVVTRMISALGAATAEGYGRFDPVSDDLTLYVAGEAVNTRYDPDQDAAIVENPAMGPLEIHWHHYGLTADLIAPVLIFGEPTGWSVRLPLTQADNVSLQIAAQQDIIAALAAEKDDLRSTLAEWGALFTQEHGFSVPTIDTMFAGGWGTITHPRGVFAFGANGGPEVSFTLEDQTQIAVNFRSQADARAKFEEVRTAYLAIPEDDLFVFQDTEQVFAAKEYGYHSDVVMLKPTADGAFIVHGSIGSLNGLRDMLAMAQSLAKRPLSAPDFDALTMDRETARQRLRLPTMQVGRTDEDDPMGSFRSSLEALFSPRKLMSYDPDAAVDDTFMWVYRTDGEYGSVLDGQVNCSVFREKPVRLSALHDLFGSPDGRPVEQDASAGPVWFTDTANYAMGAAGRDYQAYRLEEVAGLYLACQTSDADPLRAWLLLDMHKDVPRPHDIDVSQNALDQFRAYPEVYEVGSTHFRVLDETGSPFDAYLIHESGRVVVDKMLFSWDWDELTRTFTAEDSDDQVGLYAEDGTQLLEHKYRDIGGWGSLGSDMVQVRETDRDLYFQISTRQFVDYELD